MISLIIVVVSTALLIFLFRRRLYILKKIAAARTMPPQEIPQQKPAESIDAPAAKPSVALNWSEINRAYRIADMHFTRGDLKEAEKWFIKVISLHDAHAEALNRLAVIYLKQDNPRRAELLYRKIFGITQKEPSYYANYGRCLYDQGRKHDALEAYENAAKLDATQAPRFISIGQIYYELNDLQKALAHFSRAVELEPTNVEYLTVTAETAGIAGDSERQKRCLKKLLEIDPYNSKAQEMLEKMSV